MTEANLKIIFCRFESENKATDYFPIFKIDDTPFKTDKEIIIKILFDEFEVEIGKKVCKYSLITQNEEISITGLIEIYLGNNIGYCFIDNLGITFILSFLNINGSIDKFCKNDFILEDNGRIPSKKISIEPTPINTVDRANILLINCPTSCHMKMNKNIIP